MTDTLYKEDLLMWTDRHAEGLRHAARLDPWRERGLSSDEVLEHGLLAQGPGSTGMIREGG